ncbi:MAG: hypothetical protein WBF42_18520, partial [Terracidiphilus sp.]
YRDVPAEETERVREEAIADIETGNADQLERETPEAWASRVTGKIRGLLKDELAAYGGGEAFLRWVRSDDEDAK